MALALTSSAFEHDSIIPPKFTCDGDEINPALSFSGVPDGVRSFVLIVDDPDVPKRVNPDGVFDHWILFDIPPETREVAQGSTVGIVGLNSVGKNEYIAPCPPPQYEPSEHRYFFKLYALDIMLSLPGSASKTDVEQAMQGHIIGQAQLIGRYSRT